MNLETYKDKLKIEEEIRKTREIWKKIRGSYYADLSIYLQFLIFRLLLSFDGFENDINTVGNLKFNENFKPIRCAGPGLRDFYVQYSGIGYVLEATQRPILGKVEHWSHIVETREEFSLESIIGCLITQPNLKKVEDNVWNIYKAHYDQINNELFMICDVDFLIRILDRTNPVEIFKKFLSKSEEVWKINAKYDQISKAIINLKNELIKY